MVNYFSTEVVHPFLNLQLLIVYRFLIQYLTWQHRMVVHLLYRLKCVVDPMINQSLLNRIINSIWQLKCHAASAFLVAWMRWPLPPYRIMVSLQFHTVWIKIRCSLKTQMFKPTFFFISSLNFILNAIFIYFFVGTNKANFSSSS